MKTGIALLRASLIPLFIIGCNSQKPASELAPRSQTTAPSTPETAATGMPEATSAAAAAGTVIETMNSGGYTYVQVDTGNEKIWAAAPECPVKVGDQLVIPAGLPMRNYHSNTLDRDFDLVYFVSSFHNATGEPLVKGKNMPAGHPPIAPHPPVTGHPPMSGGPSPDEIDVSGIEKAEGGKTVSEIHANKAGLSGKEVTFRGKVVKYNRQIMGKNWLHVRDGSGDAAAGAHDLTITTDAATQVGDIVLVTGTVQLDKDFGFGYKYDVIIEDAQVVVE